MKKFKVLPSNKDFQNLTEHQVGWIMKNMEYDADIKKVLAKGGDPSTFYKDSDDSWYDQPIDEFDPKDGVNISEEEIQKQVEDLTSDEEKQKLADKRKATEEWSDYLEEGGREDLDMTTEGIIQENLRKAREEAERLENAGKSKRGKPSLKREEEEASKNFEPMTQESIQEAYDLFKGEEDEEDNSGPDDDWI